VTTLNAPINLASLDWITLDGQLKWCVDAHLKSYRIHIALTGLQGAMMMMKNVIV
jgi:hypothetical protein